MINKNIHLDIKSINYISIWFDHIKYNKFNLKNKLLQIYKMLKTLLTGAAVSSVPMESENGQWVPENLRGRYRSFNVKAGLAQTMVAGELGFLLEAHSITAYN